MEPDFRKLAVEDHSNEARASELVPSETLPMQGLSPRQPMSLSMTSLATSSTAARNGPAKRAGTPTLASAKVSETAVMAVVRGQLCSLEDKLSSQIQRVQQQGDRLREAAFSRVDSKMGAVESLQPKYDRRMAELSGNVKGLSDEMQSQLRRIDQMDSRLWEWRHQLEEEVRNRIIEVEQAVQQVTSAQRVSKATNEESLKKISQRLHKVESIVEEHHAHGEETHAFLESVHMRMAEMEDNHSSLKGRHEELSSLASDKSLVMQAEGVAAGAAMDVRLAELDMTVREALQKLEQLQQETHELRTAAEMQEEKCKSLRTLYDAKDDQFRSVMERLDREQLEGRTKELRSKVQELDAHKSAVDEELELLKHRVISQEQAQEVRGRLSSPRFISGTMTPTSEAPGTISVISEEAKVWQDRVGSTLEKVDAKFSIMDEQLQALQADAVVAPQISSLVGQLTVIVPKVISHDKDLKDLGQKVEGLGPQRMASFNERLEDVENEVKRLVVQVEGDESGHPTNAKGNGAGSQKDQRKPRFGQAEDEKEDDDVDDVEDELVHAPSVAAARAQSQLSRAQQSRKSVSSAEIATLAGLQDS